MDNKLSLCFQRVSYLSADHDILGYTIFLGLNKSAAYKEMIAFSILGSPFPQRLVMLCFGQQCEFSCQCLLKLNLAQTIQVDILH